jgi:hypothetical protein
MTENRPVSAIDSPVFVVPHYSSLTNAVRAHLPAVDSNGEIRPICLHGQREDRNWVCKPRETLPLGADKVCIDCDPERTKDTTTMDLSYQRALQRAAENNEEVAD